MTADVDQFVQQFQAFLQGRPTWVGNLTTATSETLIELAASVGAFAQGRIIRAAEDCFAETAQSDSSILSITQMQGLRISRYLPAGLPTQLSSPVPLTVPPLTQFQCAGQFFFNREQITFTDTNPVSVTLFEGQVYAYVMNGKGSERQTFVGAQDAFAVSDRDVQVTLNGMILPKAYGGLWNFDGLPGYSDQTMSDGRLLIQFGNYGGLNGFFGTIPGINDQIIVSYPITQGISGNSFTTINKQVTVAGFPEIGGVATANPTGGSNANPIVSYKNVASGGFGTYQSGVTKSQYQSIIATYPGIVDVMTQAQREIDPSDLKWMNVVRVAALTSSPWTQAQIQDFLKYCQSVTMYSTYFHWQDAIPIDRDVEVDVYIFNSATIEAVREAVVSEINGLFAPRPGILTTNFYVSDLERAIFRAGKGAVSYIIPRSPTGSMIVGAPPSPVATYTINPNQAQGLPQLVYAYGISTDMQNGDVGYPSSWVYPQVTQADGTSTITLTWPEVYGASKYHVWGRDSAQGFGLLATINAGDPLTFTDNGTITPVGPLPPSGNWPIRYNRLRPVDPNDPTKGTTLKVNVFYAERQQRFDTNPTRMQLG
ncbi:baseplate wedge subunit [Burkholderia phage BcepSaruman]|uniref:Baseplate wedge subunit n=1 Tax=Burkholderia phage BcepSaruman TaxID=2530032 RepID=A0A4D5ZCB2_9CAUD|nr:baseplate wedge subunit [Burkholderia phage BcepSaruman]QBX06675.1 baseplate wedge subunit [Burkholderia phage BcepSaruman]